MAPRFLRVANAIAALLLAAACGDDDSTAPAPPPGGTAIGRTEGIEIAGAAGWRWVPFDDAFCTDAVAESSGRYRFGRSTTGLAISWGPVEGTDLVVFLQGGGACWDFFTCGGAAPLVDKTASTGPFGPDEFARDIYGRYPSSWVHRTNLPPALRDATLVFVPYCTGDVHAGDRVTTYSEGVPGEIPPVTWHHVGRANLTAFLRRLGPTFPTPGRLVVAGTSAGGFGALANYPMLRAQWPAAKAYLVDDSGPPLVGDAIPASLRDAWYSRWNVGASLDSFCPACRDDLSAALREIVRRHPADRIALVSHLHDLVIRGFFSGFSLTPPAFSPMSASEFEAELRLLGATVMDPAPNAKYFFPAGTGHAALIDPGAVTAPPPGLGAWLELMLTDAPEWASASE